MSGGADNAAYRGRAPTYHCEDWSWGMPIFAIAANDCADRSDVTVAISPIRRATIRLALRGAKVKFKRRGAGVLPGDPKTLCMPQNFGAVKTGWRGKPRVCGEGLRTATTQRATYKINVGFQRYS